MTARQIYEGVLIELNKTEAPSMLLEDFNYLINKAIYQYVNKYYTIYKANLQPTDDIRVLKATATLPATGCADKYSSSLFGATYEVSLPSDYLHLFNCICSYEVIKNFGCYTKGSYVQYAAKPLNVELWSQIVNNFYMCPIYKRPYYYINNINTSATNPTNPYNGTTNKFGTDIESITSAGVVTSKIPKSIKIGEIEASTVDKIGQIRYGNPTDSVRMEIRYGKDNTIFKLKDVIVDYLKTPMTIKITQEHLDLTEDNTQIMEFPDYVCQEIINEFVKLQLENSSDPRLQTNLAVNQPLNPQAQ